MYKLAQPLYLGLLVFLPVAMLLLRRRKGDEPRLTFSGSSDLARIDSGLRARMIKLPVILRFGVVALAIIALARPQHVEGKSRVVGEGIDIVLAIDYSTSMLAEDFPPNRFTAAKEVISEFIDGREADRIALVVYAGEAYTQAPLTLDYRLIKEVLEQIDFIQQPAGGSPGTVLYTQLGNIPGSTAIGDALVEGLARLKESDAVGKVLILISDGENNAGQVDPLDAAKAAAKLGVRIYTIGIGGPKPVSWPAGHNKYRGKIYSDEKTKLDEKLLQDIAGQTEGAYFRADSEEKLREIYKRIDQLEKSEIEVEHYEQVEELFLFFLLPALLLFGLEVFLRTTLLRTIP